MKPSVRPTSRQIDQLKLVQGKFVKREVVEEMLTDLPAPAPTFRSSILKFGKNVSAKIFSIDLGKISF